MPVPC